MCQRTGRNVSSGLCSSIEIRPTMNWSGRVFLWQGELISWAMDQTVLFQVYQGIIERGIRGEKWHNPMTDTDIMALPRHSRRGCILPSSHQKSGRHLQGRMNWR